MNGYLRGMMKGPIINICVVVLSALLFSCSNSNEHAPTAPSDSTVANAAPAVETNDTGEALLQTVNDNLRAGSFAGLYVASFAGANTHSYEFKFDNGKYSGTYEEYQGEDHTKVLLQDVVADDATKTITFKQGGKQVTAKVTGNGLEIEDDIFEKR